MEVKRGLGIFKEKNGFTPDVKGELKKKKKKIDCPSTHML